MSTALIYDPLYLAHTIGGHPENNRRLTTAMDVLERERLLERLAQPPARDATLEEIGAIHEQGYIHRVQQVAESGGGWLDMDTYVVAASYDAALRAAGGMSPTGAWASAYSTTWPSPRATPRLPTDSTG
jgi:acetoin utilization deacetylase AcuC-like enzyme